MRLHRLRFRPILLLTGIAAVAILAACGKKESSKPSATPNPPVVSEPAPPASAALKDWEGTWFGPEGTFIKLTAQSDSKYEVVIRDLDTARTFEGVAKGDRIHFTRNGVEETVRATDGDATGMKWLAGKSNCLTVKQSEGYCRD